MKTNILRTAAILLFFTGNLSSCGNEEVKIDFSNIENLYAQPLPVIQECVQGKWEWYASYGGVVGISYLVNTFVDIQDNHYIITNDGRQDTISFTWKRYTLPDDKTTWVMWNKERNQGIWAFDTIKNDSLSVSFATDNEYIYTRFGACFIRVK